MKIRVLDDQVVNSIAAGEVVERPSSVVRELVDNAIDAHADDIAIWIERGGISLVRVVDNGVGMERDDAILAFERHATSKLSTSDDLARIETLGFRGEALSSIAAVAKVSLITRPGNANVATEVRIAGGRLLDVREVSAPAGTQFEIRALFYNTPARRKFLKTPQTEERRIRSWLRRTSLAHPSIRFRLFSDGKSVLNLARREDSLVRAREFFRGALVQLHDERAGMEVTGLVGHPAMAQLDAEALIILVNGRSISDRLLLRAVRDGFDSTLKAREFPVGFLRLTLPPADVDVNVHPQKSEVRFRQPGEVYEFVFAAVRGAVREFRAPVDIGTARAEVWRPVTSSDSSPVSASVPVSFALEARQAPVAPSMDRPNEPNEPNDGRLEPRTAPPVTQPDGNGASFRFSDLRYVGQLFECYLVCELDGVLYVVDMHAAHERYNYNLVRNAFRRREPSVQRLLVPIPVELTDGGAERCLEESELLLQFGIEIEPFGEGAVVVRAVPSVLSDGNVTELVRELAATADENLAASAAGGEIFQQSVDRIAARIACHASIRAGRRMQREEVYALFAALDTAQFSAACPHGRPIAVHFSKAEVEKWFGRDR